jgi:hypothetical protein
VDGLIAQLQRIGRIEAPGAIMLTVGGKDLLRGRPLSIRTDPQLAGTLIQVKVFPIPPAGGGKAPGPDS